MDQKKKQKMMGRNHHWVSKYPDKTQNVSEIDQ